MKKIVLSIALALAALATGCAQPENTRNLADPHVPGKVLAQQVCSLCHGIDGNSINPTFPKLSALPKEYIVLQLQELRAHHRRDRAAQQYMWGIARNLTDAQIDQLADYFSAQKRIPDANVHPVLAALGKQTFENGNEAHNVPACSSCHGAEGHGQGIFPYTAGQHYDYIVKQLKVFKYTEDRPAGALMKTVTHDMTEDDMKAVAAYESTLK